MLLNVLLWSCLSFFLVLSSFESANEELYRLVDRDVGCETGPGFEPLNAGSPAACASACMARPSCGLFAVTAGLRVGNCVICKSSNVSSVVEKEGWSIYMKWLKDARFHVLDTDNQSSPPDISPLELWNIDCNSPTITDKKNGVIIAMWDDKDGFKDLDKVKCFNWNAEDLFSDMPPRLLHIHLEDYRQCPKDYVLTAITASNAAFRNVDKGKCSPLAPHFRIDYDHCATVGSEGGEGGTIDKWRPWRVQCPAAGPHVAVALHRRRRVHTGLKCCLLKGLV